MTTASVGLLLVAIISLNIVWGYPWMGIFSASVSLLAIGWLSNRFMSPRLRVTHTLPNSAPAGEPFSVTMHVANRSPLPAIDMFVRFSRFAHPRSVKRMRAKGKLPLYESDETSRAISYIAHQENVSVRTTLLFHHRGLHSIPAVLVDSMFPFHLFRNRQKIASDATIAITPRLLDGDDAAAMGMLSALGAWSRRLLSGDALDYTGSREYQQGMPVRRWDFASWARLGKPIVREFQSPSVQTVVLVVDTVCDAAHREDLERLLSFAASAVTELTAKMVRLQMFLSSQPGDHTDGVSVATASGDRETYLIRLAMAHDVSAGEADLALEKLFESVGSTPVLVLTLRPDDDIWDGRGHQVSILRADSAHASPPKPNLAPQVSSDPNSAHHQRRPSALAGGVS